MVKMHPMEVRKFGMNHWKLPFEFFPMYVFYAWFSVLACSGAFFYASVDFLRSLNIFMGAGPHNPQPGWIQC